jgi:hypothetical protein
MQRLQRRCDDLITRYIPSRIVVPKQCLLDYEFTPDHVYLNTMAGSDKKPAMRIAVIGAGYVATAEQSRSVH